MRLTFHLPSTANIWCKRIGLALCISLPQPALTAEENTSNHTQAIHTRTLAASCAACHGTNGNSHNTTPVLAGLDATYFSEQMFAFKNRSRASTIMHHHAKGLNTEEIEQLSHYFAKQKRSPRPSPQPQTLKGNHE